MIKLLVVSLPFVLFYVMYQKYQIRDLATVRNLIWKRWGVAIRAYFFAAIYIMQYPKAHWQDYLLAGVINEILFELLINKIALKRGWLFIGSSSQWDAQGKQKWWRMLVALLASAAIDIFIQTKF